MSSLHLKIEYGLPFFVYLEAPNGKIGLTRLKVSNMTKVRAVYGVSRTLKTTPTQGENSAKAEVEVSQLPTK